MKLSNSVREPKLSGQPNQTRAKRKSPAKPTQSLATNARGSRPEHNSTNSYPAPPLREVLQAIDLKATTLQPANPAASPFGKAYLGDTPYPVKRFLEEIRTNVIQRPSPPRQTPV